MHGASAASMSTQEPFHRMLILMMMRCAPSSLARILALASCWHRLWRLSDSPAHHRIRTAASHNCRTMGEIIEVPSTISTTWPWGVEDTRWAFANLARRRARMVLALRYHHSNCYYVHRSGGSIVPVRYCGVIICSQSSSCSSSSYQF